MSVEQTANVDRRVRRHISGTELDEACKNPLDVDREKAEEMIKEQDRVDVVNAKSTGKLDTQADIASITRRLKTLLGKCISFSHRYRQSHS